MASGSDVRGSESIKRAPGTGYGVRSYLHYFYEECTASVWDQEDVQNQRSLRWWSSGLCKVSLVFGALVLTLGLVMLVVGFSMPSRIEAFGEGELHFVDRQAVRYNHGLNMCVQAGTGMLSLGGLMLAAGLLCSAFAGGTPSPRPAGRKKAMMGGESEEGERSPAKVVSKAPSPSAGDGSVPISLSKVESVQP